MNAPQGPRRPIYYQWWFWVVFVPILLAGTWFLKNYYDWRGEYDIAHMDEYGRGLTAQLFQYQADRLEEQYKNDTYGGDTPEETLRLFVEALEKKDYSLAAKYYVPEKQAKVLGILQSSDSERLSQTIEDYRQGEITVTKLGTSGDYEIRVNPVASKPPYFLQLTRNAFTGKWKISEP